MHWTAALAKKLGLLPSSFASPSAQTHLELDSGTGGDGRVDGDLEHAAQLVLLLIQLVHLEARKLAAVVRIVALVSCTRPARICALGNSLDDERWRARDEEIALERAELGGRRLGRSDVQHECMLLLALLQLAGRRVRRETEGLRCACKSESASRKRRGAPVLVRDF